MPVLEQALVDQAGLELRDLPASAGIKGVCYHCPTCVILFEYSWVYAGREYIHDFFLVSTGFFYVDSSSCPGTHFVVQTSF